MKGSARGISMDEASLQHGAHKALNPGGFEITRSRMDEYILTLANPPKGLAWWRDVAHRTSTIENATWLF